MPVENFKEKYCMPRLGESDKPEIKEMLNKAQNVETFIEDFRMRYGFRPHLICKDKLPTSPEDQDRVVNNVISLSDLAFGQ